MKKYVKYLRNVYFECRLDCQPCRSKKSCLKYITKSDVDAYTNIKVNLMHFNFRCNYWAQNAIKFNCTDPFVVEHRFQYRSWNDICKISKKKLKYYKGLKKYEGEVYDTWMKPVVEWYNQVVYIVNSGMKIYKRQQLFIVGPTNVGNSPLLKKLLAVLICITYSIPVLVNSLCNRLTFIIIIL